MAIHSLAMKKLLRHEGGFVDDPDDRGGATNYGITQKTLAAWRKRSTTTADVENLATSEAMSIYLVKYWNVMRLDEINSQEIAAAVMDFGVNAGVKTAGKALQRAANWVQKNRMRGELVEDGDIGAITVRYVNTTNERMLLLKFFEVRVRYYMAICKSRPVNRKFLYAWMKRSLDHVKG